MSQSEVVLTGLVEIFQEATGVPAAEFSPEQSFEEDLGFDSLTIVEIAVMVERRFGVAMPDALLGKLRTISDVSEFILRGDQLVAGI